MGVKNILLSMIVAASFSSAAAEQIKIPTDTKATYTILEKEVNGSMATIVTKREGPSGTTFSKRLYDCSSWTVKYLGDGDSLEMMNQSTADPAMTPIGDGTIAYYLGRRACN